MNARSLRQRQRRHEARKREDIAQGIAARAADLTPNLDAGYCANCSGEEPHVAYTTPLGRIVCIPQREPMAVWGWLRERWGR